MNVFRKAIPSSPTHSRLWSVICLIMACFYPMLHAQTNASQSDSSSASIRLNQRSDAFYKSISEHSDRHWLLRRVYPLIFRTDDVTKQLRWEDINYDEWDGKQISKISILRLDVFNGRKSLKRRKTYQALARFGNAIHIDTREWVVRENLFFSEGQFIDHGVMKRNLNYLNGLEYINEAHILVLPTVADAGQVEVVVVIRDKFSLYPGFERGDDHQMQIELNDHNFLGWGQKLQNAWHIDTRGKSSVGWESFYNVANIRGTFVRGDLNWQDIPGYSSKGLAFERPFLYPALSSSGGLEISDTYTYPPFDSISVDKTNLGGWYARSFSSKGISDNRYRYAAISMEKVWHNKRPFTSVESGREWHDKLMIMGSIALTQSNYGRLDKTSSFLGNERLPLGFLLEFPFGYEFGEYSNRQFVGFRAGLGKIVLDDAFMYVESNVESFIRKGKPEQGVLCIKPMLISPLRSFGSYSTRTFYRARLTLGKNRLEREAMELSDDPFYRGSVNLSGNNMMSFSLEQDFNAPLSIMGFDVALYGFVDGAVITNSPLRPKIDESVMVEGLGIRLRNPRLVWRSMQLQVAWNQSFGEFSSPRFSLSTHVPVKLLQFEGRRPKPYEF